MYAPVLTSDSVHALHGHTGLQRIALRLAHGDDGREDGGGERRSDAIGRARSLRAALERSLGSIYGNGALDALVATGNIGGAAVGAAIAGLPYIVMAYIVMAYVVMATSVGRPSPDFPI